jgi:hypothetical protein
MTLPRSVADVLDDHVTLELECIDRMYLNLYQPRLQHELGMVGFFKYHRGFPFVSSVLMDPISKDFVAAIHRLVAELGVDLVDFHPGERKDDVAQAYLARVGEIESSTDTAVLHCRTGSGAQPPVTGRSRSGWPPVAPRHSNGAMSWPAACRRQHRRRLT